MKTMQKRALTTRQEILSAAMRCFSRTGYEAASVAEICAEAGISKGALYHHFPSKHDIFMALLEGWLERLDDRLRDISTQAQDVPSGLASMTEVLPLIFAEAEDQVRMYLEFWTQATRDPQIYQALIRPYVKYTRFFTTLIERGVGEGSFQTDQPELIARIILSLAMGVLLQGLVDKSGTDWKQVAEAGIGMVLKEVEKENT
jgi:AcrR family transcriptional regulator